jgi:hypothetical protein
MWRAVALIDGVWAQIRVIPLEEGTPFSSERVLGAAQNNELQSHLIQHLDHEKSNSRTARDAIELWSTQAEADANDFDWTGPGRIRKVEEAIALYFENGTDASTPAKPATLAWHDQTAVIIPLTGKEKRVIVEYQPSLREENRIGRLRYHHAGPDHALETILDWRGYFGLTSAVVDGWTKMRRAGHGFVASITGTVGFVVASILRRLTRPQPTLERDPTAQRRLIDMSERYPLIANGCPDLSRTDTVDHQCAIVFVHGMVSCGIQGLKDLYPPAEGLPHPVYRYEHDTFRSLDENSTELAQLIHSRIRAKRLLLAAHSRGGLVARLALDDLLRRGYGGHIEVFTFGTPHRGTPIVEVGGKALNLIYKLGEDLVGSSVPYMAPLTKAYSYLVDAPSLPRGIAVMRDNSDVMDLLRRLGNSDRVRSFGSDFDIATAPSGFGVMVEGALLGAFADRPHDLLVPTESSLGFGKPEPVLSCSHVHYFREQAVRKAINQFCPAAAPPPDHVVIDGIRVQIAKNPQAAAPPGGPLNP